MDKMNIQQYADNLWAGYQKIFPELKGNCPKIIMSNRLTKSAGYNRSEENTVTLGTKFFVKHKDNMLNVILPHELAHQIDYNIFGWYKGRKHHNKEWCGIMMTLGLDPDPFHTMEI